MCPDSTVFSRALVLLLEARGLLPAPARLTLDTLFTRLVQAFPDHSATQLHQATVAACYHQARGEVLIGVGLLHQRLTVVTDQGVYIQWPDDEEILPAATAVDTSGFEL